MTRQDSEALFRLLRAYYPKTAEFRDDDTRLAWYLALKEHTYAEVRETVISWAKSGVKYPPHIDDIMAELKAPEPPITIEERMPLYLEWARMHGVTMPEVHSLREAHEWFMSVGRHSGNDTA